MRGLLFMEKIHAGISKMFTYRLTRPPAGR